MRSDLAAGQSFPASSLAVGDFSAVGIAGRREALLRVLEYLVFGPNESNPSSPASGLVPFTG